MKKRSLFLVAVFLTACNSLQITQQNKVRISFAVDAMSVESYQEGELLKSNNLRLDTNDFILKVYSTDGSKVYDGKYGTKPKDFMVLPGGYDVGLYSGEWGVPKFDQPVFGDTLTVVVLEDSQLNVRFHCRQISGGIKFSFSNDFKKRFPGEGFNIVQGDNKLKYTYQEVRYAHVSTDPFTLVYSKNSGDTDTVLLQKRVQQAQMVNMKLNYTVPDGYNSSFKIQMDTVREWIEDSYNTGLKIPTGAVTIEQAKKMVGEKNVSVFGFIYGGDPTTNSVRIAPPFTSTATFVIAISMGERNRNNSFVVELPSGKIRDDLNLVGRPGHLGRAIVVTGEIVPSYFNYIGIKGTKAYKFIQ